MNGALKEDFMSNHTPYRYIGGKNVFGLEKGEKYELTVYKMNIFERLFSKYPIKWRLVAYRPLDKGTCLMPYKNTREFESYWCKVPQKCSEPIAKTLISSR